MPVIVFYGEDEFSISLAVKQLQSTICHPNWSQFNYTKIPPHPEGLMQGIELATSAAWGEGGRLVWLQNNRGECTEAQLESLEHCLNNLPQDNTLLFTSNTKPDARLKSTKLLLKFAQFQEFPIIPPWQHEQLLTYVTKTAHQLSLNLTSEAVAALVEAVGNNSRLLHSELQKLSLYALNRQITAADVFTIVSANTSNSLKLANYILQQNVAETITCFNHLLADNEPLPKIVATLITQFRTWLWVKLLTQKGESDSVIAQAAEINNPKRLYYIRKEIAAVSLQRLQQNLCQLLELELLTKTGGSNTDITNQLIKLC